MSKKNYTNYSNKKTENSEVETAIEEVVEEATDSVVEEVVEQPAPEPQPVYGRVVNCERLNVRKMPNPTGTILGNIVTRDKVKIDEEKSTTEWYKITTASGMEGFCMKKFIAVEK